MSSCRPARCEQDCAYRGCHDGAECDCRDGNPTAETTTRRRVRRRTIDAERGVVIQDPTLELAQVRTGLDAELLGETEPARTVDGERVGQPSGSVEAEHELADQSFAIRVGIGEALELANEVDASSELDLGIGARFEREDPLLLQALRFGDQVLRLEIGERPSTPEAESRIQLRARRGQVARSVGDTRFPDQGIKAVEIELAGLDPKQITGRATLDAIARKQTA